MTTKLPRTQENGICAICTMNFDDPRLLPCKHTYCFRCIRAKASPISGDFICPMKDGSIIKRNQIASLKVNDDMRQMVDSFSTLTSRDKPDDTDDTGSTTSESDFGEQNSIYVNCLPVDVHDQWLMNTLNDLFRKCGRIKVIITKYFIN